MSYSAAAGLPASIKLLTGIGLTSIREHAGRLAAELVEQTAPLGWTPYRALADRSASGHIVSLRHPGAVAGEVQAALATEHRIHTSSRGAASACRSTPTTAVTTSSPCPTRCHQSARAREPALAPPRCAPRTPIRGEHAPEMPFGHGPVGHTVTKLPTMTKPRYRSARVAVGCGYSQHPLTVWLAGLRPGATVRPGGVPAQVIN
jgi:hypothetical protein